MNRVDSIINSFKQLIAFEKLEQILEFGLHRQPVANTPVAGTKGVFANINLEELWKVNQKLVTAEVIYDHLQKTKSSFIREQGEAASMFASRAKKNAAEVALHQRNQMEIETAVAIEMAREELRRIICESQIIR